MHCMSSHAPPLQLYKVIGTLTHDLGKVLVIGRKHMARQMLVMGRSPFPLAYFFFTSNR